MRKRLLYFECLVIYILQKSNSSANVCLDDFFDLQGKKAPGKGALSNARSKLSHKVYKRLNLLVTGLFYQLADYKKCKGFRLLAVDGSTLRLPHHDSLAEHFSNHGFGSKKQKKHWMGRISYLYDVRNELVLDASMESFKTSEAALCRGHMPWVRQGDMVLFDRYYCSYKLMGHLLCKGAHFMFRLKSNAFKFVKPFLEDKKAREQEVCVKIPKSHAFLLKTYPFLAAGFTIRLVKKVDRQGKAQVFCTSLLDRKKYSRRALLNLYKERWMVEEAFKLSKARMGLDKFSGKTAESVLQEFHAKSFLVSFSSAMRFKVGGESPKRPKKANGKDSKQAPVQDGGKASPKDNRQRKRAINRTFSIHQSRKLLRGLFLGELGGIELLEIFISKVSEKTEYSRKGQSNKRSNKRGRPTHSNSNYKDAC